jgi:V-type H+-transporting ATPase subunit E
VESVRSKLEKFADPNNSKYQALIQDLIIQGMTLMLEPELVIQVRKQDEGFVKGIISTCEKEYSKLLKKETGRDYSCTLSLHTDSLKSPLGGVYLFDKTLKIECTNDLESRLELSYGKLLPEIKRKMFK